MRRKIYDRLVQWKQEKDGSTALMIEGARRIGKSYIAEEFARNEYDSYILIDFSKAPTRVKGWFDEYLEDVDTLLQNIQLHYKKQLTPRKSLIIFDEVQKCPRAREAIKALVAVRTACSALLSLFSKKVTISEKKFVSLHFDMAVYF